MAELDPQAQAFLESAEASGLPPAYTLTIQEARARARATFVPDDPEPIAEMTDVAIDNGNAVVAARAYYPGLDHPLPILVFFHGGGWILNDLDTHDRLCSTLATSADCVVLSVDYRRSPEHKYPAAIEDARSALEWVASNAAAIHGDASRIAVGGDSAGGALAATLAKLVRDEGGPQIRAQLLFYPVTDYLEPRTKSYDERGVGYSLTRDYMAWAWAAYLPAEWSRDDPYLFPLRGDLAGLPPAIIYTAEYDPLRDEGAAYAEKLRNAGVPVEFTNAEDQMHGFAMHTHAIDRAAELVHEAGCRLRKALSR
jgi:acetyl esterase